MISLASLPRDIVELLLPFLTGFDLFQLSHAHRGLFLGPLAASSPIWRDRVGSFDGPDPPTEEPMSWKQFYCTRMSLRFFGASPNRSRAAALEIHNFSLDTWESEPFSFEMWFALLPADPSEPASCFGGIALGAQSEDWQDEWKPDGYEAFVLVDPDGNLECSVGDERAVIAKSLQPHRWYHLALTYEHEDDDSGTECVYLDGQLVVHRQTELATDWEQLYYMQLATGFIDESCPHVAKLYPNFSGWYDFNGVINSFHIYEACLSADEVVQLASCGPLPQEAVWAFDPSEQGMTGTAQRIHCTRPRERACTNMRAP